MFEALDKSRLAAFFRSFAQQKRTGPIWKRLVDSSTFGSTTKIAEIQAKTGLFNIFCPIRISVLAHLDSYACHTSGESVDVTLTAEGVLLAQTRVTFDDRGIADLDVHIGHDHLKMELDIYLGTRSDLNIET